MTVELEMAVEMTVRIFVSMAAISYIQCVPLSSVRIVAVVAAAAAAVVVVVVVLVTVSEEC